MKEQDKSTWIIEHPAQELVDLSPTIRRAIDKEIERLEDKKAEVRESVEEEIPISVYEEFADGIDRHIDKMEKFKASLPNKEVEE